jgi:hypothetical protein
MVGRNAAARVWMGLLEAVVAATRRAAGRRSSMEKVRMNVVGRRKERRKGRKGMLVSSLVGRAAARRRGRNVLPRTQCLVSVGARALPSPTTPPQRCSALTPPLRGGDETRQKAAL